MILAGFLRFHEQDLLDNPLQILNEVADSGQEKLHKWLKMLAIRSAIANIIAYVLWEQ